MTGSSSSKICQDHYSFFACVATVEKIAEDGRMFSKEKGGSLKKGRRIKNIKKFAKEKSVLCINITETTAVHVSIRCYD